jgi:hypothetical protein
MGNRELGIVNLKEQKTAKQLGETQGGIDGIEQL